MDDHTRLARLWEETKSWITEFDGTPILALLVNIPAGALVPGLTAIAAESEGFRITSIPEGKATSPAFIPIEALPEHLVLLQEGKLEELSVNYAVRRPEFDLDLRLIVYALPEGLFSIEIDWWNDQVFSDETDNPAQLTALLGYFTGLQKLFSAPQIFLSPESGKDQAEDWIEF